MATTNTRSRTIFGKTHEGGRAAPSSGPFAIPDKDQLIRHVSTCLLFENTYYESGNEIADNIRAQCAVLPLDAISEVARLARGDLKLRHVPLFLAVQMARRKGGKIVSETIRDVIQRPDEMGEMVSLYWKEVGDDRSKKGHSRLPAQLKKGLALAFQKFSAYQIAKWNEDKSVKLKDVLFLSHAKPKDEEQAALWKSLIDGTLQAPDTWEVALSAGKDKKETWTRLLNEKKLGYMALLMNLRNMTDAGVDELIVNQALVDGADHSRALPFRFVSAAKFAPQYAQSLSDAMMKAAKGHLAGRTALVVDVSGSMVSAPISAKSKLDRLDAASALSIYLREVCESCRVFTFSTTLTEIQNIRGIGLATAIRQLSGGGTMLAASLAVLKAKAGTFDRIIVVTDEQTHDGITTPWTDKAYLINVAPNKPGLDTHEGWNRVSGWSERIVDWIAYSETGRLINEPEIDV